MTRNILYTLSVGVFVVVQLAVDLMADNQPISPDNEPTADTQAIYEDSVACCCPTYSRRAKHTPTQQATTT